MNSCGQTLLCVLAEEPCLVSDYKVHLSWPILFFYFTLNSASLELFEILFLLQSLREKVIFSEQRWNGDPPLSGANSVPCWYSGSLVSQDLQNSAASLLRQYLHILSENSQRNNTFLFNLLNESLSRACSRTGANYCMCWHCGHIYCRSVKTEKSCQK